MINILILQSSTIKGPFSTLLTGLACADFLFASTSFPMDIWGLFNPKNPYNKWSFTLSCYIYFGLYTFGNSFFAAGAFITSSIMVFRFIAIKFPLKANILITIKRVKIVICFAFFLGLVITSRCFAQFTIVQKANSTERIVVLSKPATHQFLEIFDNIQVTCLVYLPWTISFLFMSLIIHHIRTASLVSKLTGNPGTQEIADRKRQNQERRVTVMLLTIVILYLLSGLISGIRHNLRGTLGRKRYYSWGVSMTIFD